MKSQFQTIITFDPGEIMMCTLYQIKILILGLQRFQMDFADFRDAFCRLSPLSILFPFFLPYQKKIISFFMLFDFKFFDCFIEGGLPIYRHLRYYKYYFIIQNKHYLLKSFSKYIFLCVTSLDKAFSNSYPINPTRPDR